MSTRRDTLTRLGDKLDAAVKLNNDEWATLFHAYEALTLKHAMQSPPPRIAIKSITGFWQARTTATALYARMKSIEAEIAQHAGDWRLRTSADLKALWAVTRRDWLVVEAAVKKYQDDKKQSKAFWQQMRRAERKTVASAGFSFPVVVQFGRRS
jgi:hypothetical protein